MKTIKAFSAALLVLAATACNSDYINESVTADNLEPMIISSIETKTVFTPSADGGSVAWTAGDKIAVFDNLGGKNSFTNSDDATASFSGKVTSGTTAFWAVYPEELVKGFSNASATVTLPADQTIAAGTFAEDLNISVTSGFKTPGTPEVAGITFSNVCAMVSFELPARIDAKKVTFTAANKEIAGDLTVNCEDLSASVTANGSKSVSMTGDFPAGSRFYFVVAPGAIEGFRIDVETEKGSAYYKSASSAVLNTVAGKLINLPVIDFTEGAASASASHVYDNGTLTGSAVAVNHGIPESMWADVTAIVVTVQKDGKIFRTYSAESVNAATVNPSAGNVYLPQGTYDVNIAYTMNGVETVNKAELTSAAPAAISVNSLNATTSYSLYKAGNTAGANSHDARTISAISASITGVSAEILAEMPVSYTLASGNSNISGTSASNEVKAANMTGLANGSHTVTFSASFDGVTASASTTCHITGLPYTLNPAANDSISPWTEEGQVTWNESGKLKLGQNQWNTGDAFVSKDFNLPENTSVTVNCAGNVYGTGSIIKVTNTFSLSVSGSQVFSKDCKGNGGASFSTTSQATMSASNASVRCNSSYNLEQARVLISSLSILYR